MVRNNTVDPTKALLLGATGRLGAMIRTGWPEKGGLLCQSRVPREGHVAFDLLADPDSAIAAMRGAGAVVCLSGVTPLRAARDGSDLSLNVDLAVAAAGAGRVFLASSAAVYGAADGTLSEDAPCAPLSDYGRSKLDMERVALRLAADLGQPATVLRIGNVAGADAILGGWREGMQLDRFADGTTPARSYIGPLTLARIVHALCCRRELPEVINIAAPGVVHMGALLDAADLPWHPRPAPPEAIARVSLDTKRLEEQVRFAAQDSTPGGMVSEWRYFNAQE